jgi:hypothetical protein
MAQLEVRREAHLAEIQKAEHTMVVSVAKATAVAVPLCIVIWLGIALLALSAADWPGSWASMIAIGAVVGVFAGVFFGGWAGVLAAAHVLDSAESHRD